VSSELILIAVEAFICMLVINATAFYISRKGLATKILLITSPTIAASFLLGLMFAYFGFSNVTGAVFFVVSMAVGLSFTWAVYYWLVRPINTVAQVGHNLASGKLDTEISLNRKDELGQMVRSIQSVISYLQEMATNARQLAEGDLTVKISPRSEDDMLGHSFAEMADSLRLLIGQIQAEASQVAAASGQLSLVAEQSGQTTQHIAAATQEQSSEIAGVANITGQISDSIQQVARSAQTGADGTARAVQAARTGVNIVDATITGMERIKIKVGDSSRRVTEMGQRSEEIGFIVETIDDIAGQTNLLALNAAIEAARAGVQAKLLANQLLDHHMIIQAHLINELLVLGQVNAIPSYWQDLARRARIDNICITDDDGVVIISDQPELLGLRFSDTPSDQTYEFRQLLGQQNGTVCQQAGPRVVDGLIYKYIGISRQDQRGIVQIGFHAKTLNQFTMQVGGFGVVADEVRKLAEKSGVATKKIAALINGIQTTVTEAVTAMSEGAAEVENGVQRAHESGQALKNILLASEEVSHQTEQIAAASQQINASAAELVSTIDGVSAVVESNTAATEQMAAQVEEVTASAQALSDMANVLQNLVDQFQIEASSPDSAKEQNRSNISQKLRSRRLA
jgi:methyl-accepting chemotaxis protein